MTSQVVTGQKDSQWLQLDVCTEYQLGKCEKVDCRFAHPLAHVEVTEGKVMACYDSFKGRCYRTVPLCKYYHPTATLMEQLIARGKVHLAMKNAVNLQPQYVANYLGDLLPTSSQKVEIGTKRAAEMSPDFPIEMMYFKRPAFAPMTVPLMPILPPPIFQQPISVVPSDPNAVIPLNAPFVNYTDANGQILDNLPVCQDFNRNMCTRINCKFVHLLDPKKLEIHEHRVAVCRDHTNGICRRQQCKYYHIPIQLPSATEMALSQGN